MSSTRSKRRDRGSARPKLVAGLVLDVLVDAFRVGPLLDATVARQLREWRDGIPKEVPTKKRIVRAVVGLVATQEHVANALAVAMLRWSRWAEEDVVPKAALNPALAAHWLIEHTLHLVGVLLGTCRHAMNEAVPTRATIPDWVPTGFDRARGSLTGQLLAGCVRNVVSRQRAGWSLRTQLEMARRGSGGQAVKPHTIDAWMEGRTTPNGLRLDELSAVVGDPLLRAKMGIRGIVERLAPKESSEQDTNTTLLWMSWVEWTAVETHRSLAAGGVTPEQALEMIANREVLERLLPTLRRESSSADLPLNLAQRPHLLLEAQDNGKRVGLILMPVPAAGTGLRLQVSRVPF